MPRPALPPTPGSSSDINGKDGLQQLASLQLAFELPPPAIHDADAPHLSLVDAKLSPLSPGTGPSASPSTAYSTQPAEAVKSRRRASTTIRETKDATGFALPPPPTRSRRIIQMKPRTQESLTSPKDSAKIGTGGSRASNGVASGVTSGAAPGSGTAVAHSQHGNKKKQPSAASAARKTARKTAHCLIERRRRNKMNEEFALLKSMIPACTGEMHKLAILQASIEYVRYLEDCVAKLRAQEVNPQQGRSEGSFLPPIRQFHPSLRDNGGADLEMTDSEAASPVFAPQQLPISPALQEQDPYYRHHSYSSVSTDQRQYSYSNSTSTSPAFGPQPHAANPSQGYALASDLRLTSPALHPQNDPDQEATAALLMLNSNRRDTILTTSSSGRGLSVRDLLSS